MTDINQLHLVFKTHLDLGFTDLANNVLHRYLTDFIPHALKLARHLREIESPRRFVWTTGSWLVDTYLEQSDTTARREMEQAIETGDLVWHALPFTTHTEIMDIDLFSFGLSLSQRLDDRFGRHTIAGKMTDVPCHTRGMVPLLAEAGVEFLHFGVNEASSVPNVPPLFVWRDEASDTSVIVAYSFSYGEETIVPALGSGLAFAFTGDNLGPPDEAMVNGYYDQLQARYPNTEIRASTLDAFALELRQIRDTLPVITSEIGDTWIHGVGSDPAKLRRFREYSRIFRQWTQATHHTPMTDKWRTFGKHLLCVAEHTWGLDVKTHLTNFTDYSGAAFAKARQAPDFKLMEQSWQEQRHYLDLAAESLGGITPPADPASSPTGEVVSAYQVFHTVFHTPRFDLAFDPTTGAIIHLRHHNRTLADSDRPFALFRYETFSQADYDRYWQEYIRNKDRPDVVAWSQHDYMKHGLGDQGATNRLISYTLTELRHAETQSETVFTLQLASRPDLTRDFGAPPQAQITVTCPHNADSITFHLTWDAKPATRIPEAAWLSFTPLQQKSGYWRFEKLGSWIDPLDVVECGNRQLHAINDRAVLHDGQHKLTFTTLDSSLVALGEPSLLRFPDALPDPRGGVHFNLFNNIWCTNFPQWIDGAGSFRFVMNLE